MPHLANHAFAACAALFLSLALIGAIVAAPPAGAAVPAALAMPALA